MIAHVATAAQRHYPETCPEKPLFGPCQPSCLFQAGHAHVFGTLSLSFSIRLRMLCDSARAPTSLAPDEVSVRTRPNNVQHAVNSECPTTYKCLRALAVCLALMLPPCPLEVPSPPLRCATANSGNSSPHNILTKACLGFPDAIGKPQVIQLKCFETNVSLLLSFINESPYFPLTHTHTHQQH